MARPADDRAKPAELNRRLRQATYQGIQDEARRSDRPLDQAGLERALERYPGDIQALRSHDTMNGSCGVERFDGERLAARFGFFRAEVSLANIVGWDITGPYRWWRAVGVRRTLGTRDLSFGGSAHGGVCLHFREPVLVGRFSVTDLYLTVDDLAGLGAALTAHGCRDVTSETGTDSCPSLTPALAPVPPSPSGLHSAGLNEPTR